MRLILPAGKGLPEHVVDGPITMHCLEGAIDVTAQGRCKTLRAGNLMYLAAKVLLGLKAQDDSLTVRKSCREGVCGCDGMNTSGRNGLACITPVKGLKYPIELRPLPSFPVIRDLVVDMTRFFKQYYSIKPYLINNDPTPERARLQSPEDRDKLNGMYECILCGCCTSQCPSSWWNPDKFVGPAGLLQACRFIIDSRDQATRERLDDLNDPYRLFRCRSIMNCTQVCPKDLAPSRPIEKIRRMMAKDSP